MKKGILFGLLLLGIGLTLRVVALGHASYTIDEINVVRDAVGQPNVDAIYRMELERFTWYHRLPFLMAIIHVWVKTFGGAVAGFPPESVARLPFALLGALSLPIYFLLGRAAAGPRTGWWLAALATFNIFHLFYSREAYDYALVLTFLPAVLWAGLRLLREWESAPTFRWPTALLTAAASWCLLQSHLAGLLFLGPWNALLAVRLFARARRAGAYGKVVAWLVVMALPYLIFMPFVLRVFSFVTTESPVANRVSWSIVPELLGRMGWGESLPALIPFAVCFLGGLVAAWQAGPALRAGRLLVVQTVVYLIVQTYALRVGRFEVRYYAPVAPLLLLFAAWGLDWLQARIPAAKVARAFPVGVAVLVAALTGPSLKSVIELQCRGYNYKGLAQWLNAKLPNNGIYSYWNVYDGRGVPAVYPTPGRFMAYPIEWSSAEDYKKRSVRDRLTSFFLRFPTAAFVETAPMDILAPTKVICQPINRDALFLHKVWLEDPAYQQMVKWKTFPLGEAQWESTHLDRMMISYNRPEDLPELARRRGQPLYHCFGNEWEYVKDQQMNDWLSTTAGGTFQVGNITSNTIPVQIKIAAFAHPAGCMLNIHSSTGGQIATNLAVPSQPRELTLPVQQVAVGRTEYFLEVLPPTNTPQARLLVYSVTATPVP